MNKFPLFYSCLILFFFLTGCKAEDSNEVIDNGNQDVTDNVSVSDYDIPEDWLVSTEKLQREYTEQFYLDDISAEYNLDSQTLVIVNYTPRYLSQPTVQIDGKYYKVSTNVKPFERKIFKFSYLDDVKTIKFIDEQPFFNIHMNTYLGVEGNDKFELPSSYNAMQYEKEMNALKSALNDYDFNLYFAQWLTDYDSSPARARFLSAFYPIDDHECLISDVTRSGNDSSPTSAKIISLLTHRPRAAHRLLMYGSNGVATVGSGWLSVLEQRLYQPDQVYPKTTYLHEKLHTHGFSHNGGMTYGLADELVRYAQSGHWQNYYDAEYLSKNIPTTVAKVVTDTVDGYVDLTITFWSQLELNGDEINRFMIVLPESLQLHAVQVNQFGYIETVEPQQSLAGGRMLVFESDWRVKIHSFDEQESAVMDSSIKLRFEAPSSAVTLALLASGEKNLTSWSRQANAIVEIQAN